MILCLYSFSSPQPITSNPYDNILPKTQNNDFLTFVQKFYIHQWFNV